MTLIWRLLLFPFPCYFPGFWSWGTLFPRLPFWFTSGLAWPRSMLFGHCTQLGLFLQLPQLLHCHGSLRALSLKRPSEPNGSRHLVILLTLCWHLHLWYYPSICSFFQQILPNIYGQGFASPGETNTSSYSRGPLLLCWLFPVTPSMCRFVSPTWLNLTIQHFFPSEIYSGFSGQGPEPCKIFVLWEMEINRFSPRKEGIFVFTGPKFLREVAMWGYRDQEDWNVYYKENTMVEVSFRHQKFPICFYK